MDITGLANDMWWNTTKPVPAAWCAGSDWNFGVKGLEYITVEDFHVWAGRLLTHKEILEWTEENCDCNICQARRGLT